MRERIVYPRREILSNDVNSITEYNSYNDEIIVRDLLGVSSGIVNGLNISTSVLTATISSGNISFGNGRFNELLTNSSVTLPNSNGTYYIYAYKSITTDIASSGYVLLDVSTRLEDYDVVNSRTYDSIGLNYGASTPSSGIVLYSAVVSGGSITSTTDLRSYVTFGNITAYSLQQFYNTNKNGITLTASTSGIIINGANSADYGIAFNNVKRSIDITQQPDSHGIYIKKTANGTTNTANSAIKAETRQNSIGYIAESIVAGAGNVIGFYSTSAGGNTNIGFGSDNANIAFNAVNSFNGAVGLNVVGFGAGTNDAGFLQFGGGTAIQAYNINAYAIYMSQETNPNVGVGIELRKFNDAINIVGLNSTDSGINITNSGLGLSIINLSQASAQKSVSLNIGGTTVDNYGVFIDAEGDVTAQRILFSNSGASDTLIGLDILSNSSQNNKGTAIKIGGGSNTFEKGIVIEDCATTSLAITQGIDTHNVTIDKDADGTNQLGNSLIRGSVYGSTVGILLLQNSPNTTTDSAGIWLAKSGSYNYEAGIVVNDSNIGINIQNVASGFGIDIVGVNSSDYGIDISACDVGMRITNSTASDIGISLVGHGTTDKGVDFSGHAKGVTMTNYGIGIELTNGLSNGIGILILGDGGATNDYGIKVQNSKVGIDLVGSSVDGVGINSDGIKENYVSQNAATHGFKSVDDAKGMYIFDPTTHGIHIVNTEFGNSPIGLYLDDVYQSILIDGTAQEGIRIKSTVVQQLIIEPKASLTSTADGQIAVFDNGAALKFRFYDDTYTNSWIDLN